jgi:hypothetical protein
MIPFKSVYFFDILVDFWKLVFVITVQTQQKRKLYFIKRKDKFTLIPIVKEFSNNLPFSFTSFRTARFKQNDKVILTR